jgi:hypothetical protein
MRSTSEADGGGPHGYAAERAFGGSRMLAETLEKNRAVSGRWPGRGAWFALERRAGRREAAGSEVAVSALSAGIGRKGPHLWHNDRDVVAPRRQVSRHRQDIHGRGHAAKRKGSLGRCGQDGTERGCFELTGSGGKAGAGAFACERQMGQMQECFGGGKRRSADGAMRRHAESHRNQLGWPRRTPGTGSAAREALQM